MTLTDAVLAFPLAYFMARLASKRTRAFLFVMVLLPLWSSYLVRIYAWQTILAHDGAINWGLNKLGLPDQNLAYTNTAMWIVLHVRLAAVHGAAGLRGTRADSGLVPRGVGATSAQAARRHCARVILPLALPGLVAGSIFTFALTLGDYITPLLIGGTSSQLIGNTVYNFMQEANTPFAAAFATIPMAIVGVYLLIARRLGAFEAL